MSGPLTKEYMFFVIISAWVIAPAFAFVIYVLVK